MLNKILKRAETIAIGGHVRPDGDCVGSCMGMYQYIADNYKDKEVDVYLEEIPDSFKFLKGTEDIRHKIPSDKIYDLFICLDCGDADRLEFSMPLFEHAKDTFCVDHHVSNVSFARENYIVPDASSTSELVFDLIDKDKITKSIAEALYLGIVHDTGVFQYSCAGPSTFMAAAELLKTGIDGSDLIRRTFYEKSYARNQILGRALLESSVIMNGKCIVSYLRKKVMEFHEVSPKDLDGIVSQLRNTRGVEVAIFMYELEPDVYKVSLRSGDIVDVSSVAGCFGGGGHKKAAGVTMTGTPQEIIHSLSLKIEEQLRSDV